jgi:oligosaccharide repeat unit polymerase
VTNASVAALVCSIALIAWAVLMRALAGTWLQPSAFFALWWCFAGIVPLLFAPGEHVGVNAMAWLVAASIAVSAGAVAGNYGFRTRKPRILPPPSEAELRVLSLVLTVSLFLGIGSGIASLIESHVPLSAMLDVQRLVVVSNQFYVARLVETAEPAQGLTRALLPFVYLAPALGGIVFVARRKAGWKLLCIATLIPSVMVTVLQTTKAALLFAVTLWLSGYFTMRLRQGKTVVFTKGHLAIGLVLGGLGTILFLGTSLARLGSTDLGLIGTASGKLIGAAFGHMTVLSQWLTEYWTQPFSPTLGKVTFAGPLELVGVGRRIPGLFESLIDLISGDTSNIYTAFRPLIQDFTLPGAIAALVLVGFVGGISFRMVATGNGRAAPVLIGTYATIFWTPITWFWIYNSLTATMIALAVLAFLVRRRRFDSPRWRNLRSPIVGTG